MREKLTLEAVIHGVTALADRKRQISKLAELKQKIISFTQKGLSKAHKLAM